MGVGTSKPLAAPPRVDALPRFPVVGIGASAGGLRAIQTLFDNTRADTGMAFVVIVHLDPNHKSHMAEILARHTAMPVEQVSGAVRILPNHVYIIPPDKDLSIDDGHLRLSPRRVPTRNRAPIDLFLRTLAETHDTEAIGIVLSGTGSDGTQGIKWVNERGGVTMVQTPADADYDGMPLSAIATGKVDLVLPAAELGAKLSQLRDTVLTTVFPVDHDALPRAERVTLTKILTHVHQTTGHDFTGYKPATVYRRLQRRIRLAGADGLRSYLDQLRRNPVETEALFNDTLVVVTSFFRDPDAMAALERDVVPALFGNKGAGDFVRVWVAGCATGEEAYTIAMLLREYTDTLDHPPAIQIFATDVHEQALTSARVGLYPESIAAEITPERIERFFTREPAGFRIRKSLREKVLFATHNVLRDPPFLRLDLVACRNVLIYLQRDCQQQALAAFHFALRPEAFLFLGVSESADAAPGRFTPVDKKHHIYRASPHTGARPPHDAMSAGGRRVAPVRDSASARTPDGSFASLHQQLVETHGPPSLVVDSDEEVVHLSNRVGEYLERHAGVPSNKLLDMVTGDLRLELRGLLRAALRTGRPAEARGVRFGPESANRRVNLSVRPLVSNPTSDASAGSPGAAFALVVFDEVLAARTKATAKRRAGSGRLANVAQLEEELRAAKANLITAAEEHDATVEALRASNEELQSTTEEQRAIAEELEASKEELQSINEELRTINQEHRVRNDELAQLNSDLMNFIDSTSIGTIFLDRELRIRRYTPAVTDVFNVVPADRGRPLAHITNRLAYDNMLDDVCAVLASLIRAEREIASTDGRWFTVRITPYRSIDDKIDGAVLTFIDTTERRRAELEHEQLLKTVQEVSSAKSDFIGVMSHEFRTPLNAIVGYAGILAEGAVGPVSDEQRVQLGRITTNAQHLEHLVDQILSSAHRNGQPPTAVWMRVDLASLVTEAAAAMEALAAAKSLTLHVETPSEMTMFLTDATMLRQILFNLLGNAIRYTDEGTITIRARRGETAVVVEVEDTGIGIAPEHLGRVFERFWQADQTRTRRRGGTGLGLMVSRTLAEALGGTIAVESEKGRGSLFRVRLPQQA